MSSALNYNFFNTLIFSGIIYGLVFCTRILLNKKYTSRTRTFLMFTVLSMTLSNLQYWLIDIGLRERYEVPKVFYVQFELLILPFFFLFIRGYLKQRVAKKYILLLMAPFFLGMMYQISTYMMEIQKPRLTGYNFIVEILTISYSLLLIILILIEIFSYEKRMVSNPNSRKIKVNTIWLKQTLIIGITICTIWVLTTQLFYLKGQHTFQTYYPLWIGISVVIYWVGNKGVVELKIVREREFIRSRKKILEFSNCYPAPIGSKGMELFKKIVFEIDEQQLYTNPNVSLQTIADIYDISTGYLSQLINMYSDESFTDFINKLRIREAKKMLKDNSYNQYTIIAIALESGFNTKSNFYSVFKKETKMTPSQYKKVQNL
ncbi:hypothetical protein MNBD_BACTEROID03-2349 [hydrothermal vent metagenome]|uniref:HTH araC/xylS-type domain-containing protein n=1 Tax=hydrothermal vent metagenome TaxID=652676 RepID=A0A3B0TMI7_9ZZZZ